MAQSWTNLGSGMSDGTSGNPEVFSLAIGTNGELYAGGDFTFAGDVSANYIAKWVTNGISGGEIGLSTTALAFAGTYGGTNPAGSTFTITNLNQTGFNFTNAVSYGSGASGWLSILPADGSIAGSGGAGDNRKRDDRESERRDIYGDQCGDFNERAK